MRKLTSATSLHLLEIQILLLPLFILLFASAEFFLGYSLQNNVLWLSLLLTVLLSYHIIGKAQGATSREIKATIALFLILLAVFYFINLFFYDASYDGQGYHQASIIALYKGWNPIQQWQIKDWNSLYSMLMGSKNQVFVSHYARASELIAASIFKALGFLQAGKLENLLYCLLTGLVAWRFLIKFVNFPKKAIISLTVLLAANPVIICQLFTYYVDGALASFITVLIILLLDYLIFGSVISLLEAGCAWIILSNIKFTGLVYGVIIIAGFFLWLLIKRKKWQAYFSCFFIATLIAIGFVGFQPYITNTIVHNNPFYPAVKAHSKNIISGAENKQFSEHNRFVKFVDANFSTQEKHAHNGSRIHFALIPLSKTPYHFPDTRLLGFGPVFGLLFFVGLFLLLFCRSGLILYTCAIILISIFITPAAWWARLAPQAWLIPLLSIFGVLMTIKNTKFKKFMYFLIILLILNITFIFIVTMINQFHYTLRIRYQLDKFQQEKTTVVLPVSAMSGKLALFYRFKAKGIPVQISEQQSCTANQQRVKLRGSPILHACIENLQ